MATIKSYTDIEQSKKLAEILPIESADMIWYLATKGNPVAGFNEGYNKYGDFELPCWSLAALLDIVKTYSIRLKITLRVDKNYNIFASSGDFVFRSFDDFPNGFENLVDACMAMIKRLHELNLL